MASLGPGTLDISVLASASGIEEIIILKKLYRVCPHPVTHRYLRGFVAKACPGDRGISALSRFSQTSPGELPMGFAEPAVSRFSGNTSHGRESYQNCQGDCLFYISFKFARKKSHPPPENGAKTCVLLHFLSR